jgi:hypothetical protein
MKEVLAVLGRLAETGDLPAGTLTEALRETGWSVRRQFPGESFARHWENGGLLAGIQGDSPTAKIEFTLWSRDVGSDDEDDWDPDADTDDLDAAYDEAETTVARFAAQAGQPLAAFGFTPQDTAPDQDTTDATGGPDYIKHHVWRSATGTRTLLLGAIQDDTDLPVRVVAVIS